MKFDWKKIVGSVAPVLGTALGGPLGGIAGKFIADGLGIEESKLQETIASASPDTMLKLKQLDNQFEVRMAELDIDIEKINAQDRQSARQLAKDTTMVPQVVLSVVYTVAYAVVLWAFVTGNVEIAEDAVAQFSIVLGVLTAAQAQILNFWFGSSSGSKQKTTIMGAK